MFKVSTYLYSPFIKEGDIMAFLEFSATSAFLSVSIVSFLWIIKQIVLLCNWFYKHEIFDFDIDEEIED